MRATLSHAVATAVTETYDRKAAYEAAQAKKEDVAILWAKLRAARDYQARASRALADHIKEHGCKI